LDEVVESLGIHALLKDVANTPEVGLLMLLARETLKSFGFCVPVGRASPESSSRLTCERQQQYLSGWPLQKHKSNAPGEG